MEGRDMEQHAPAGHAAGAAHRAHRAHRARQAARGGLYAGLVALALWWAATGEWLDGFDAALWLLCFFAIEGNILEHEHAEPAAPRG